MKQKKIHRLDGNHNLPFALVAISCYESHLKTAWNINRSLNLNLKESENPIEVKENPLQSFPVFCDRETSPVQSYSLISNKISNFLLIKELPNVDFIFEISGEINRVEIASIIRELKQVPGIIAALEIELVKIKRKTAFCPT